MAFRRRHGDQAALNSIRDIPDIGITSARPADLGVRGLQLTSTRIRQPDLAVKAYISGLMRHLVQRDELRNFRQAQHCIHSLPTDLWAMGMNAVTGRNFAGFCPNSKPTATTSTWGLPTGGQHSLCRHIMFIWQHRGDTVQRGPDALWLELKRSPFLLY